VVKGLKATTYSDDAGSGSGTRAWGA
jgi:hypothetical protein